MKLNIVLFFAILSFCNCKIQLPKDIFAVKDAIEAEGNRAGVENLRSLGIIGNSKREGKSGLSSCDRL